MSAPRPKTFFPLALFGVTATLLALGCKPGEPDTSSADTSSRADVSVSPDADLSMSPDAGPADAEAGPPDAGEPPPDAAGGLPTEASNLRLLTVLADLSSEEMQGRLTGAAGGDRAEAYLVETLRSANVEVLTQEVTFPLYEVSSVALEEVDAQGASVATYAYIDQFREVKYAASGEVTSDLFFVGYGLVTGTIDSYAGVDVGGKVVAVLTGVPSGSGLSPEDDGRIDLKLQQAAAHGAVGAILIPAGLEASYDKDAPLETELSALDKYLDLHTDVIPAAFPALFVHVASTPKLMGRSHAELVRAPASVPVGKRVRVSLTGKTTPDAKCRNVLGVMRGTSPTVGQEVVILGAHYDHLGVGADGRVFYGAGDNASGTSVVVEAATALALSGQPPQRTLLFALFCAEEQGLRGSFYYTYYGEPTFPLAKTKLMVQVDYLGEEDGPYVTNLDGYPLMQMFLGTSMEDAVLPVVPVDWEGGCASDDCAFLMTTSVPAYRFLSTGQHHHQTTDRFENMSKPMVKRVADVVLRGLEAVAF